ncbi:collagen alpha-1(I) chain-like [Alligator mississippiensis]|uniref:Collagen alpha-1(I) chain-like n=1 Tax=Alligator mississippiensis TaxID=8496 RepID=A0A151P3G3_ALLMI|nr:collagen alpha-1(I) chain-like [Alligator mississippiensis]
MLTSFATPERLKSNFIEGQVAFSHLRLSNNRSVMPLDVQGCTYTTLTGSACVYPILTAQTYLCLQLDGYTVIMGNLFSDCTKISNKQNMFCILSNRK